MYRCTCGRFVGNDDDEEFFLFPFWKINQLQLVGCCCRSWIIRVEMSLHFVDRAQDNFEERVELVGGTRGVLLTLSRHRSINCWRNAVYCLPVHAPAVSLHIVDAARQTNGNDSLPNAQHSWAIISLKQLQMGYNVATIKNNFFVLFFFWQRNSLSNQSSAVHFLVLTFFLPPPTRDGGNQIESILHQRESVLFIQLSLFLFGVCAFREWWPREGKKGGIQ